MTWIDTMVVIIVITLGLLVMYRALKEPIDLLLNWIKKIMGGLFGAVRDGVSEGSYEEVIRYG